MFHLLASWSTFQLVYITRFSCTSLKCWICVNTSLYVLSCCHYSMFIWETCDNCWSKLSRQCSNLLEPGKFEIHQSDPQTINRKHMHFFCGFQAFYYCRASDFLRRRKKTQCLSRMRIVGISKGSRPLAWLEGQASRQSQNDGPPKWLAVKMKC